MKTLRRTFRFSHQDQPIPLSEWKATFIGDQTALVPCPACDRAIPMQPDQKTGKCICGVVIFEGASK